VDHYFTELSSRAALGEADHLRVLVAAFDILHRAFYDVARKEIQQIVRESSFCSDISSSCDSCQLSQPPIPCFTMKDVQISYQKGKSCCWTYVDFKSQKIS
jgi:hypothetical protein